MRYAVDRYILGHEREVAAKSFLPLSYIPSRKERFFCPECGETVFFRAKGDGEFYHQKQTESTPECDKRVDGRSGLSLYERTGLSMYIVPNTGERYCLGISFPPLGKQTLDLVTRQKANVRVIAGGQECKFRVSSILFSADQSTLLPVDFIPPADENYTIEIRNTEGVAGIRQKWTNYADGFEIGGALFQYSEESGRKIHRGDGISSGKQYYLVTKQPYSSPYPEIQTNRIGSIRLKNGELTVSKLTINVSIKDTNRYLLINNYFRSRFGVWLLETTPELTTLWPPTALKQDAQVLVASARKKLYCSVSSGNDTPNVYFYLGNSVSQLNVVKGSIILPFHSSEIAVSIDRKYVGREVFYRRSLRSSHTFYYEFSMEDSSGNIVDWETFTQASLSMVRSVKANAKMELIIGCKGHVYQHVTIREGSTPMPALEYPEDVYWVVQEHNEYSVFFYCHAKENTSTTQLNELCILSDLRMHRYGPLVPAPVWMAQLVRDYSKKGNVELARFICSEISGGKIQLGLLKTLFPMGKIRIGEDSK